MHVQEGLLIVVIMYSVLLGPASWPSPFAAVMSGTTRTWT
jgi:hypothetical protein